MLINVDFSKASYMWFLFLCTTVETSNLEYTRHVWFYYDIKPHNQLQNLFNITYSTLVENWNVHYLTSENLAQYLNTTTFPDGFSQFSPVKQADYLRIALLQEYGGWYFDFSTLITSSDFLEHHYNRIKHTGVQFFAFGWPVNRISVSLNVIYAPRGSAIIRQWYKEITNIYHVGRLNYMYTTFRENICLHHNVFRQYPFMWTYFYVNVAFQVAIQKNLPRKSGLEIYPSTEGQYALLIKLNWDPSRYAEEFRKELLNPHYPIYKLAAIHRRYLWPDIQQHIQLDDPESHPLKRGIALCSEIKHRTALFI